MLIQALNVYSKRRVSILYICIYNYNILTLRLVVREARKYRRSFDGIIGRAPSSVGVFPRSVNQPKVQFGDSLF